MKTTTLALFVVTLLGVGLAFAADDAPAILREIDDKLEDIAADVKDLETRSDGAARAGAAISKADDVADLLRDLGRVAGSDRTASDRARNWPRAVSDFKEAAEALKLMKGMQGLQDKAAENCKKVAEDLQDKIDEYVKKGDQKGLTELPREGRKWGPPIKKALEDWDKKLDELKRKKTDASAFSEDEAGWRDVRDELRESAQAILDHYEDKNEAAHKACDDLARGEDNPKIKAAITAIQADIKKDAGKAIADFEKAAEEWEKEARTALRLDCEHLEKLWEVYCGSDLTEADELAEAKRIAKTDIVDALLPKVEKPLRAYKDLVERGQLLLADPATQRGAKDILDDVKDLGAKLERVKKTGALRGADHPLIQYAIEYGKQQHAKMQSSWKCVVAEKEFGSGNRPDCIVHRSGDCFVVEFKPDNDRAEKKGLAQLARYQPNVEKYYEQFLKDRKIPPGDYGGKDFISVIASKCSSGNDVAFRTRLEPYRMCDRKYECVK